MALLRLGVDVHVGAPDAYQLAEGGEEDPRAVEGPGVLRLFDNAFDAVKSADVVYTDAWVSMGFEDEIARRRADLASFRVNAQLLAAANPQAIVMHCLPAHRGDEIRTKCLIARRRVCGARSFIAARRWWACCAGSKEKHDENPTTTSHR